MINQRMREQLEAGRAIDLAKCPREGRYYRLAEFVENVDYCDAAQEAWIWSIGRRYSDGTILASRASDLYQNPEFECLFLR